MESMKGGEEKHVIYVNLAFIQKPYFTGDRLSFKGGSWPRFDSGFHFKQLSNMKFGMF